MRLRLTEDAASDLESIKTFTADFDDAIADGIIDRIAGVIRLLCHWPHMGHAGSRVGTFEMAVPRLPFVIIYRLDFGDRAEELIVLRIYHMRRDRAA